MCRLRRTRVNGQFNSYKFDLKGPAGTYLYFAFAACVTAWILSSLSVRSLLRLKPGGGHVGLREICIAPHHAIRQRGV
jgi:hypothetical protein